jgi:hypothetical protein
MTDRCAYCPRGSLFDHISTWTLDRYSNSLLHLSSPVLQLMGRFTAGLKVPYYWSDRPPSGSAAVISESERARHCAYRSRGSLFNRISTRNSHDHVGRTVAPVKPFCGVIFSTFKPKRKKSPHRCSLWSLGWISKNILDTNNKHRTTGPLGPCRLLDIRSLACQ